MIFIQSPCIARTDFLIQTDGDPGESWIIPRPFLGHPSSPPRYTGSGSLFTT